MEKLYMGIKGEVAPERKALDSLDIWDKKLMVQEKADGIWCAAVKKNGSVKLFSRTGKEKDNAQLDQTREALAKWMPSNSIVVGELGFGSSVETEWAAKNGFHRFIVFDVIRWKGSDKIGMKAEDRFKFIADRVSEAKSKVVHIVEHHAYSGAFTKDNIWAFFESVMDRGGEGIVIKEADSLYVLGGGRTDKWHRIKGSLRMDYVIMGFTETTAKTYLEKGLTVACLIGGLYKDGKLVQVVKTSSFDLDMRKEFSAHPKKYIGKVVELAGKKYFPKTGSLRHPDFIRIRTDKKAKDCVYVNPKS